jgi:hypothetical protein
MNATNKTTETANRKQGFAASCQRSCRKVIARLAKAKESIFAEFRSTLKGNERLLQLALAEAEALAWQTDFPHLFFPTLAVEKAQAVASWNARQRWMRHTNSQPAFTA